MAFEHSDWLPHTSNYEPVVTPQTDLSNKYCLSKNIAKGSKLCPLCVAIFSVLLNILPLNLAVILISVCFVFPSCCLDQNLVYYEKGPLTTLPVWRAGPVGILDKATSPSYSGI